MAKKKVSSSKDSPKAEGVKAEPKQETKEVKHEDAKADIELPKETVNTDKNALEEKPKHTNTAYIIFGVVIGIIFIIFISQFIFKSSAGGSSTTTTNPAIDGQYDSFAKCLTEKGAVFYGTEWCPHCSAQKEMFGSSMQYIHYVQCQGSSRSDPFPQACIDANIEAFPTWIINGKTYLGAQTAQELADATGCSLI